LKQERAYLNSFLGDVAADVDALPLTAVQLVVALSALQQGEFQHQDLTRHLVFIYEKAVSFRPSDLVFLSPYTTGKLKRFGVYPTDLKPHAMPTCTALPQ